MSKAVEVRINLPLQRDGGLYPKGSVIKMTDKEADDMEASGRGKRVLVGPPAETKIEKSTPEKP